MNSIAFALAYVASKAKNNLEEKVISFLKENPNPDDSKVHSWAEDNKFEVKDVESAIYKLATKFTQILSGGRSIEKGLTESDVDSKQLKMGIKVEMEHTDDKEVAKKIALDHLAEFPNYYTALIEMEKNLESKE